jgi:hypothetical protein
MKKPMFHMKKTHLATAEMAEKSRPNEARGEPGAEKLPFFGAFLGVFDRKFRVFNRKIGFLR